MIAGYMCTCGVGEDRPQKRHYVRYIEKGNEETKPTSDVHYT